MEKRVEKVVERIRGSRHLTIGEKYVVISETEGCYVIIDDDGDEDSWDKIGFKVVSEGEVLEFEGFNLDKWGQYEYCVEITSEVDITNYDIKVIATPKDKTYEDMSKEELIKLLKTKE